MIQFCLFGGYEGPLSAEKKICFTVFGGSTLHRPTLARQMIAARHAKDNSLPAPKMVFITIFGASEIKYPTLAEEFIDLREAIDNSLLDPARWDFYMAELDRWTSSSLMSLTLFAGFSESELPAEDEELDGIALQRHFGALSEESSRLLEMGVGRGGSHRRSILRQAVMTA